MIIICIDDHMPSGNAPSMGSKPEPMVPILRCTGANIWPPCSDLPDHSHTRWLPSHDPRMWRRFSNLVEGYRRECLTGVIRYYCYHFSDVQRFGDARDDCLNGCPPYQILVSSSSVWWSLLLDICFLWRHNMTSNSRFQTNVWAKFVDTTCIFPPFSGTPVHIILHALSLLVVVGHNVSL